MEKDISDNVLLNFPGKMVTVNNHKIHVYSEGNGTVSLVFMSGGSTPSPFYDFKTFFSEMVGEYKIIVIEKAGYGFSDITNSPRDIGTILNETRIALKEANLCPPYILFPHSMSGIEALYWVQNYPQEINAIIGIDAALPIHYENMNLNSTLKIMKFASKIINGKFKYLFPNIINLFPPLKFNVLNENDKKACKSINYYRIFTNDMINEVEMIKENAEKINIETIKDIPMLLFISNGKGTGFKKDEWKKLTDEYIKELSAEIYYLNGGHYLHNIFPEDISNISKAFIKNKIRQHVV